MSLTENRLSIRLTVDTNIIGHGRGGPEMAALWQFDANGWIQLMKTDAMDTELHGDRDPRRRAEMLAISAPLQEQLGVMVVGHSRVGASVLGGEVDQALWDQLWDLFHAGKTRATARDNDIKDVMHVMTAIRYGSDGLVTLDGLRHGRSRRGILAKAPQIRAEHGFKIWTPSEALAYVERRKKRTESREHGPPSSC